MRLQDQEALTRTEEGHGVTDGVGYESKSERVESLLSCGLASTVSWDSGTQL